MEAIVAALAEQQAELTALLATLDDAGWQRDTRCEGWDVRDVVLHLAQTNELALGSAQGRYPEVLVALTAGIRPATDVDDGAAAMVDRERDLPAAAVRDRWETGAKDVSDALLACDPRTRVEWVAGELSARTLATTRLAETWIHTGDVADALGLALLPTDRLREIARLAWRTLPYAFARAGRELAGPVALHLRGPSGDEWSFVPDTKPLTTIRGDAAELCAVAGRRVAPEDTGLTGDGPDAGRVLALIRTYA